MIENEGGTRSLSLLESRCSNVLEVVRETLELELIESPSQGFSAPFVITGAGASVGPAKLLAHQLTQHAIAARFVPLSAFASPSFREGQRGGTLVVLSQGLSPNAGLALRHIEAFEHVIVLTAADPFLGNTEGLRAARLMKSGAHIWTLPCGVEQGLLIRVLGPLATMVAVLRLADSITQHNTVAKHAAALLSALESAPRRARESMASLPSHALLSPMAFVTTHGYDELCHGLSWKWLEGVLSPAPPVWDVLQVAHGPFQQIHDHPFTLISLEPQSADTDPRGSLIQRLDSMLIRERHSLIRLHSSLESPMALLDHDMQLNALMIDALRLKPRDLMCWPGQGSDAPLYELGSDIL